MFPVFLQGIAGLYQGPGKIAFVKTPFGIGKKGVAFAFARMRDARQAQKKGHRQRQQGYFGPAQTRWQGWC